MAEQHSNRQTTERHETTDPDNPPENVLRPEVRRAALWLYLGPLVAICAVLGIALLYWSNYGPAPNEDVTRTIGTAGNEPTPGGIDPDRRPRSTRDEMERRGVGGPPQGPMPGLTETAPLKDLNAFGLEPRTTIGRRIDIQNVKVVDVKDSTTFWIQDGTVKAEVMAPAKSPAVRSGTRVDISGVVEADGRGGARIRATPVTVR